MSVVGTGSVSANPDVEDAPAPRRRTRRQITRTAIFVLLYFAILVYPILRLLGLLLPGWTPNTIELLVIIVGPILGRIVYERHPTTRDAHAGRSRADVARHLLPAVRVDAPVRADQRRRFAAVAACRHRDRGDHRHAQRRRLRQHADSARQTRTRARPNERDRPHARADQRRAHRLAQPAPAQSHRRARQLAECRLRIDHRRSDRLRRNFAHRTGAARHVQCAGALCDRQSRTLRGPRRDRRTHALARRDRAARRSGDAGTVSVHRHRRRRHRRAHSRAVEPHRHCRPITMACCCTTGPTGSTPRRSAAFR